MQANDVSNALDWSLIYSSYTTLSIALICFIAISLSAYVKIATVLGILRVGLGFSSIPSAFVTGALAIALSYCVMLPVMDEARSSMQGVLGSRSVVSDSLRQQALATGLRSWLRFLSKHSNPEEVQRFGQIARKVNKSSKDTAVEASLQVLAPAFLVSQLREAFRIGLRIFLPFVVIDLLVGLLVTAIGIEQRVSLSLSFATKLLLFVLCDGWGLITGSLVGTYLN